MDRNTKHAALQVSSASKRFGTFQALRNVDLTVRAGEIHALLGHNGAGKSTLINAIGGAFQLNTGTIEVLGKKLDPKTPSEANNAGISIIHQHLSLIDSLSVVDNLFLGDEIKSSGRISKRKQALMAKSILNKVGASCDPHVKVQSLTSAQRQLVEIAKALRRKSKVLILDEPTAALSDVESKILGDLILQLRNDGLGIIYVTHLLQEVERLADKVSVLEDGEVSFSGRKEELSRSDLVKLISGRRTAPQTQAVDQKPTFKHDSKASVLRLENYQGKNFGPLSINMEAGEVIGLFGMLGSGRSELLETIAGARKKTSGKLQVLDREVNFRSPQQSATNGVLLTSGDRSRGGLFHDMNVRDNLLIGAFSRLSRGGLRSRTSEQRVFAAAKEDFNIRANPHSLITTLSGGNQQKVMLGRAVSATKKPLVLLLDGPTQGVDVASRKDIYVSLRKMAMTAGVAILFSSSDPEEILDLSDRVLVMRAGQVVASLDSSETSDTQLIYFASHGNENEAAHLNEVIAS